MGFHYSEPFEALLDTPDRCSPLTTARVVVVGSGYGGAVAAYRLSGLVKKAEGREHELLVLERGREYVLGEFPETVADLPGYVRADRNTQAAPGPNDDALFNVRIGDGVDVVVGCGLGGTSLINANVALRPPSRAFETPSWPSSIRREAADQVSSLNQAFHSIEKWLNVAGPDDRQRLRALPKYKALERFGHNLGFEVEPAPITVTLGEPGSLHPSAAGVRQKACTLCGNCVTGCNVGAKNTLTMNLIPAARERGARFLTGVQVLRIESLHTGERTTSGPRWRVVVRPITRETRVRFDGTYAIDADVVVLSGGTLGSTEILQRSHVGEHLECSPCLGTRFSTNGDGLAMSFGETDPVHAIGHPDPHDSNNKCGPTISAVARGRTVKGEDFTLEEGAIPAGLTELFGELVTTGAQMARLGNNQLPGWFRDRSRDDADVLSVQPGAVESTQVFLVMGDDGARGELKFSGTASNGLDEAMTLPVWHAPAATKSRRGTRGAEPDPSPLLTNIEATLSQFDCEQGQNFGQYIHNPLWHLMPPSAAAAMAGKFPGGRLLTVHPLGGCPMADHGRNGVVNDTGQVFVGATDATHPGLYVLDGSIVPTALGVNPFLTIASLAWRACDAIVAQLGGEVAPVEHPAPQDPPTLPAGKAAPTPPARIIVTEQLVGLLDGDGPRDGEVAAQLKRLYGDESAVKRCFGTDGLILQITGHPFELAALERPGTPVPIDVRLYRNILSAEQSKKAHAYGVPKDHLKKHTLIASGSGSMTIMSPDAPNNWLQRAWRTLLALIAFLTRRESLRALLRSQTRRRKETAKPKESLISVVKSMCKIASMHGTYRDFRYDMTLSGVRGDSAASAPRISFVGTKRIAWRPGYPRLWKAFTQLQAEVSFPTGTQTKAPRAATAVLTVDVAHLVGEGLLQVTPGDPVPRGILGCLSFVFRMARCAIQAGFWEFGAPDYPKPHRAPKPKPWLPERLKNGAQLTTRELHVPSTDATAPRESLKIPMRLHSYLKQGDGKKKADRKPVLLIHGLAQGSLIYAHRGMKISMAEYFSRKGYDVWLLDYRLSNQFTNQEVPYEAWSIDEIGKYDVPTAVKAVLEEYPAGTRLHVFAHCVGAIGVTMAILQGALTREHLASVVLNAIHPWTVPSPANRVRAKLGVFFRDWLSDVYFDPIIQSEDKIGATQSLLDRLGFSLARLGEDIDGGHQVDESATFEDAICDRMTFLYGRMWKHQHIEALHKHWKDLVGRAPGTVQRHLYYLLLHHRVVNREGLNTYLLDNNVRHWQGIRTLFIHGEDSRVFNPQSATESAVRMRAVLDFLEGASTPPKTPVGLRRIPDYGHMDVILANSAPQESYRYVEEFFDGQFDRGRSSASGLHLDSIDSGADPHGLAKTKLLTGPIMRAARLDGNDLILRMWMERPIDNTSPDCGVSISSIARQNVEPIYPKVPKNLGNYSWVDVRLPADAYKTIAARAKPGGSVISSFLDTQQAHLGFLEGLNSGKDTLSALADAEGCAHAVKGQGHDPSWLRRLKEHHRDCHFLVGSCLYPGTPFDCSGSDQAFAGMLQLLSQPVDCDLLFLIGDQIYADATNGLLDPTPWRDRYVDRYRAAFRSAAVAGVLNALPCHFAIDDHEFADNYAGYTPSGQVHSVAKQEAFEIAALKTGGMGQDQFLFARDVARAYMGSARGAKAFGNSTAPDDAFWYALDDQAEISCPAFILDTRSERKRAAKGTPARLMSDEQMKAFIHWLSEHKSDARPKFVFFGSPIMPLTREAFHRGVWMRQDGPTGYPDELSEIVRHIASEAIQRVIFVAGDPHLSCAATMELSAGNKCVSALHIVSSGLYSPLSFANMAPSAVDWSRQGAAPSRISLPGAQIEYRPYLLTSGAPHFLRVSAIPEDRVWRIRVQAYDGSGDQLEEREFTL